MGKPAKTFEDLIIWKKAHQFVLATYTLTQKFPKEERYGLSSQFRRSAVSIAANITEGFKKRGVKDKARFLNIAQGSLEECHYYLILPKDLQYGQTKELNLKLQEVSKLLNAYRDAILSSGS